MRRVVLVLLAAPAIASAQGLSITHEAAGCVVADQFPGFGARFDPADSVAEARVLFRPPGGGPWYSVRMKRDGAGFGAVLPKPKKSLKSFSYYVEATDRALATARTEEFNPIVAAGAAGCQGKMVAPALGTGQVTLEAVSGAPRIPLGFSSSGVASTTATAAAGATAAGAAGATAAVAGGTAAAAAGGGGISTAVLVAGGVVVAGGAAVAVATGAVGGGGGGGGGDSYNVLFTPDINVSSCAGRNLTWCCQGIGVDSNGNFSEVWARNEPNTARISGRLDATSFTATLACFSGGASTSLSATGSGGTYRGTFAFGSSSGNFTVVKQ